MPTYVYFECFCRHPNAGMLELNVPMDDRDNQLCKYCGRPLDRKIAFSGLTWAPTAGGMR